ncbi:MBOAT, membrane-bound O-acyltransferase family-domain-containing protein [Halteromyces radiatus]|uniref:MBOAT, membrane-bound O-acyltransferase family-domain-containing protein n=1 Tax=Halteromyces radiatus TaxID=101107 RepID=UPI00221FFD6D|nr:MBOAT, membrane-bound O-acyltransferase family-domain-containing protein [Halteromyces radiatus]KAI8093031.1 MBOAT, membrane-bound O-acyltransferase family-domain-containing protein [Halteromyces radiatus]
MTGSSLPSSKDEKQNTKTQTNLTTNPPRWNTPEFYFYYLCFIIIVPYMFYIAHSVSKETNPHYPEYASRLSDGWIFGRKVDNSDAQYAHFRDNLPKLLLLSILFVGFNRLMSVFTKGTVKGRLQLLSFTSLIVVVGLHGTSAIKILIIISTSYLIGRFTGGSKLNPILSWAFNLGILFLNEAHNGYTFTSIHSQLDWLDEYPGISPRWHILFNFVMLRLISYNMDYYWQIKKPRLEYKKNDDDLTTVALSDRDRIDIPCNSSDYNYIYFLAYVLYTPLYMCGPILTYNDFISQLYIPSPHVTRRFVTIYGLRLVGVILVMEWTLHYIYVVAISKERAWDGDTPLELSMIGYFNLVIIWMKLLILWRFFRLWALVDGIWTEENMVRCMSNNFSAQRFWKSWHRTFNRWLIRYVYIPLGGAKYFMFNMWIVFTFVALWHDIELKLLAWGWLICLFLLPEIIASQLFSYKKFGHKWYYRFVCGIGAVGNILMMMIANLVGFCVGLDGMKDMLVQIFGTVDGLIYLFSVICTLFVGVQVMFEIRESEKRRGDKRYLM